MSLFSTESTVKLIDLYRKNECLWKISNRSYRRTDLKNSALAKISEELNIDVEEIKKKIRNLRNTYVQQKKRLQDKKKSGSAYDGVDPKWFLFEELKFLDEVIVLRKTTSSFQSEEVTENDYSEMELDIAEEAVESCKEMPPFYRNSNKKQKKDKYEEAISSIMAGPNTKPTIFETFCSAVSMQLEELHKLDVAESFTAMQEIQTLVNNKIIRLVKSKPNSCSTCSLQKATAINGNLQPIQIISNNLEHSTDFSDFSDDLCIMTPPPTSIESYKPNIYNRNSNNPGKSKSPNIFKTSSTMSATVTSSPPLISKKVYIEKTPTNPSSLTKYILPPKTASSQPKSNVINDDDQHSLFLKNSEISIDYLNDFDIATIPSSSTITSPSFTSNSMYNTKLNVEPPPPKKSFPEKRIKILEDVKLGYKYDPSYLIQTAANDACLTDEDYIIEYLDEI